MGQIRIRSDGVELELADEATLRSMQAQGRLAPGAERWDGERWRPLVTPRLPAGGADPWSAWSEADEAAAEAAVERVVNGEEPAELPLAALTPMPRAVVVRAPEPLPDALVTPLQEAPAPPAAAPAPASAAPRPAAPPRPAAAPVAPPSVPPRPPRTEPPGGAPRLPRTEPPLGAAGELIDFPRRARPAAAPPSLSRPAPEPAPLVRPWRVLGMVGAMLLVVGGLWAVEEMSAPLAAPVVSVGKPARPAATDPLAAVEAELRGVFLGPVREVRKPGDLEDALLLDLQQLGVSVVSVQAPVTRWTGRKRDDPAGAEVHVAFTPGADLNRDLGAIALAVGRYKLHYKLSVSPFEVVAERPEGRVATALDPAKAERFAQGRVSLTGLLAAE